MNKKKLPRIRQRLPKFRSDEEAAEYFETHAVTMSGTNCPRRLQQRLRRNWPRAFRSSTDRPGLQFPSGWAPTRPPRPRKSPPPNPWDIKHNSACGSRRASGARRNGH